MKQNVFGTSAIALSFALLAGCGPAEPDETPEQIAQASSSNDLAPNGRGNTVKWAKTPGGAKSGANGISYHGGPVMLGTNHIYYIWYGNWAGNSATTILTDLAQNLGGSPYFNINTTYYNGANTHVSNAVTYAGSTTDN